MKFLTSAEKVQKLRNQLNITQEDLQTEKVTRGLISMIETGRREVTYNTAVRLAEQFSKKAQELNIILNIDEGYLMRSPSEDAEIYCLNKLKNDDITDNTIKEIFELIDQYNLLLVQAKTYFKIGQLSSNKRDFGEAIINYNKAINIYKSMGKSEELGYVYLKMGICKTESLKYDTAIVYYGLSQYYSFVYEDKKIQRFCLYNLANNYLQTNEIELALNTIEKCLVLFDKERVSELYMFAQGVNATCYEAKGEYSIAIEIYKTALSKLTDDESTFLGYAYNNLGLD